MELGQHQEPIQDIDDFGDRILQWDINGSIYEQRSKTKFSFQYQHFRSNNYIGTYHIAQDTLLQRLRVYQPPKFQKWLT